MKYTLWNSNMFIFNYEMYVKRNKGMVWLCLFACWFFYSQFQSKRRMCHYVCLQCISINWCEHIYDLNLRKTTFFQSNHTKYSGLISCVRMTHSQSKWGVIALKYTHIIQDLSVVACLMNCVYDFLSFYGVF